MEHHWVAYVQRFSTLSTLRPSLLRASTQCIPFGVFKAPCLNPDSNAAIDQKKKTSIDLFIARLQQLC